jgi:hypothetical protein
VLGHEVTLIGPATTPSGTISIVPGNVTGPDVDTLGTSRGDSFDGGTMVVFYEVVAFSGGATGVTIHVQGAIGDIWTDLAATGAIAVVGTGKLTIANAPPRCRVFATMTGPAVSTVQIKVNALR